MILHRLCRNRWLRNTERIFTSVCSCAKADSVSSKQKLQTEAAHTGPLCNDMCQEKDYETGGFSQPLSLHVSRNSKFRLFSSVDTLRCEPSNYRVACHTGRPAYVMGEFIGRNFERSVVLKHTHLDFCYCFGLSQLKSLSLTCVRSLTSPIVSSRNVVTYRYYSTNKDAPKRQPHTCEKKTENENEHACGQNSRSSYVELYENPWTIPNLLCMARIGLSPYLGYLIVEENFNVALGIFAVAGLTDLLDGYIARNWANQKSALGSALDPLADKILISFLYISMTYAGLLPAVLTAMVILRDIVLIGAVFYIRYKTVTPPKTISKYFNPRYATAQLKPTVISKVNTAVQLVLVAASLAAPVFHYVDSLILHALWYITAFTTTASAYSYYHYGKRTIDVLNHKS